MKRFLTALILSVCCLPTLYAQDANGKILQDEDSLYYIVEQMPRFQGGDIGLFYLWTNNLIRYPLEAAEAKVDGTVVMKFVVECDGTLSSFEAISSPHQSLTDEAIRVLKTSPKWEPGIHEGKPVRVGLTVPFKFMITQEDEIDRVADATSLTEPINENIIFWLKYEDRELSFPDSETLTPDGIESFDIIQVPVEKKAYIFKTKKETADVVIVIKMKKYTPEDDMLYWFLDENREITPDELKTFDAKSIQTFVVFKNQDKYSEKIRQIIGSREIAGISIIGSDKFKKGKKALEELGYRMPTFLKGGLDMFRTRVSSNLIYPESALKRNIEGNVIVKFIVDKDGSVTDIEVISSSDPLFTKEAVRVLKTSPKWSPGTIDGEPVRIAFVLPLEFSIQVYIKETTRVR
jgi:TonB family protein